ncbi:hypothetical protein CPAR01_12501 [Colletotrichum paranaense]|uniref:Uncharacterized protein n=1 Tax=Colletotrichum paranaense TaxID=1914294 RepID=A0ABQ9S6N0_9PEZI|nr:uncharacterized protein CPAR01_12501 [Colletotrichum paranaense]KAK1527943.1 hypothetical protein CPAR01_12501 [Colletotrichum paranaense]
MVFAPAFHDPPCTVSLWLDIQPTTGRVTTVTAGRRIIGTRFSDPPGRNYSREIFSTVPYDPSTVNMAVSRTVVRPCLRNRHRRQSISIRDTNSSGHLGASECRYSQQQCSRAPRGSGPGSGGVCKKTIRTQVVSTLVGGEEHREHQVVLRQKPRAPGTTGPGKAGHCQWWLCLSAVRSGICTVAKMQSIGRGASPGVRICDSSFGFVEPTVVSSSVPIQA